ncbi:signal peptidase I [Viscerimonas tarda]
MTIKRLLKKILVYTGYLLVVIVLTVIVRVFFFDKYSIPSQSMSPAIEAGDQILVNKLIPGARIIKSYDFIKTETRPDIWRAKACRSIRRNDVMVFNFPYSKKRNKIQPDMSTYYVKRCVAIPGDTFYIDNGIYKVNGVSDKLGNYEAQLKLSQLQDKDIPQGGFQCFPKKNNNYYWTMKRFGPLYIPHQDECLAIDLVNIALYRNLIEYETSGKIKLEDNKVSLNGKEIKEYTFSMNYYFMAGDNVFDSRDSRYWGLLPEDHIVGKAFVIYKSKDLQTDTYRWNRFFKSIE